jgi:hypothetical protein
LIGPPPHERRGRGLETRPLLTRTQSATARSQIMEILALLCILETKVEVRKIGGLSDPSEMPGA